MKNKVLILSTFLCLFSTLCFAGSDFIKVSAESNKWEVKDSYAFETITGDDENGYVIQDLTMYGERVKYVDLLLLDGLSFDYYIDDFTGADDVSFKDFGFYFSSYDNRYAFDADIKIAAFSFLSNVVTTGNQDRFSVFDSCKADDIINNNMKNHVLCYSDIERTNRGFGYIDGTLVSTHEDITGFHFQFSLARDGVYQVDVTELVEGSMWSEVAQQPIINYDSGSTYFFVNASNLDVDKDGCAYLFLYGVGINDYQSRKIHVNNIQSNSCTINFNTQSSTSIAPSCVKKGECVTKPEDPTQLGKVFEGWFVDTDYSQEFDFNLPVTRNLTLYAKWKTVTFNVTFNSGEGSPVGSQVVKYGEKITEPNAPTLKAHSFEGWYTDEEFVNKFNFKTTKIASDITLYAKFEAISNYYLAPTLIIVFSCVAGVIAIGLGVFLFLRTNNRAASEVLTEKGRKKFRERNKKQ